ncbi:LuxR family transcriptional regulator [Cupriavidus necator]|uniref:LuxR C-terminal-related transcriptional regulator n=1 Tax=Cupriavidus necator TaxID=106590 RepID=UPI00148FBC56|nr:LuxR C-terminal-related transcriptional regulator [Cupriavidus necator]NOV22494.1 LuxR family transcriptional regulator [Cupriavidus necator]
MRVAPPILLSEQERTELETLAAAGSASRVAQRARIILLAASGEQNKTIAPRLGIGRAQVARWRERYAQAGVAGIVNDLPRGAPPVKVDVARLVALASERQPGAAQPWSTRRLAAELGVSAASVSRHWRAAGLAGTAVSAPPRQAMAEVAEMAEATDPALQPPPAGAQSAAPACLDAGLPAGRGAWQVASDKVLPPRGARQLMPREALMARLLEARRQRCVVIQGQAGSGKTSTLMAWRKAMLQLGYDVCWLTLAPEDNEPARFFECLLASIAEVDPAAVREAALLVAGACDDAAIELWVITLVQALARRRRDLVLMIDDLHHVADPRILQALQWLLDYAPATLHLAFSSRSALVLSQERLRLQGTLAEFDMRDLRFTPRESERFLREQLGAVDSGVAATLHALTDGWVAGLQLFAIDLRTRGGATQAPPMMPAQVRDARAFASYFEREVLVRMQPDDLDMLMRVAVCQRFCAPLCAAILGDARPLPQIQARLCRLVADNLFINAVGSHDHETWYRIHPLLRETLLNRLVAHGAGQAHGLRALHATAWRWFEARGEIGDAVFHAVRAGDVDAAAGMVQGCAQALLERGELVQLGGLLRALPVEEVRRRFGLHVVLAYMQLYSRDFDALRDSLDRMETGPHALRPCERYSVRLLRAGLAVQLDNQDEAAALLPALWQPPPDADDFAWHARGNVVSWLLTMRGDYDLARQVLDQANERAPAPRSGQLGRCIQAISLAREGRLKEACRLMREVMEEAERCGAAYAGLACMAACLLADALYELNETEAACQLLEPRLGLLERVSLPEVVLRGCVVLSGSHWLAGRRTQALACLERLEAYAGRYGLDRLHAEALAQRLRRHLQQGETERANLALEQVQALAARCADGGPLRAASTAAVAARARLEMALYTRDYAVAVERARQLAEARTGAEAVGAAGLRLQMALARRGLGQARAARRDFIAAMRQGHRLGLTRTLLDAAGGSPEGLAPLAQAGCEGDDGREDPVLAFYIRRLLAEQGTAEALPPPVRPRQPGPDQGIGALSEREREILELLAQAMSNKKIARVLNVSAETVKWHLKNIYAKLGVAGRGGAAARLRDLAASASAAAVAA